MNNIQFSNPEVNQENQEDALKCILKFWQNSGDKKTTVQLVARGKY